MFQPSTRLFQAFSMSQCAGTTKKGTRCLRQVKAGQWCHSHGPASLNGQNTPKPPPKVGTTARAVGPVAVKMTKKQYTTAGLFRRLPQQNPLIYNSTAPPAPMSGQPHLHIPGSFVLLPKWTGQPLLAKHPASPKVEVGLRPGYIYVYTLSSFLLKDNTGRVLTRNLLAQPRHKDKWVGLNMRKLDLLLVKVGMTTKTPAVRIRQWEVQCNHKLTTLVPGTLAVLLPSLSSLVLKLRSLSLENSAKKRALPSFHPAQQGFFVPRDIGHCEKQIHDILKQRYGRGEVRCTACMEQAESGATLPPKSPASQQAEYKVHNEWFPVPRAHLPEVFRLIDGVCRTYKP